MQYTPEDFISGQVILIDKPLHFTSFDVVNRMRYRIRKFTGVKKIKVGHAGTLDPLATGLLVICTGKMTKKIDDFQGFDKEYTGTLVIGATTPSFDLETEIDKTFSISHLTIEDIKQAFAKLEGEYDQMPPQFSAKRINGERAYEYARANKEVVLQPKRIHIKRFEITDIRMPYVDFVVTCTKGTYIRSLVRDVGVLLNNGAYMSALRRVKNGEQQVSDAIPLDDFCYWFEGR